MTKVLFIYLLTEAFPQNLIPNPKSCILFPETRAIARTRAGTHASKFTYAIYRTREIIVFSRKEKLFIEGFAIEHIVKYFRKILRSLVSSNEPLLIII